MVVYCLLMCSHLRCQDLSVEPWTATLMVLWPFLRLMASMAAARRDCFSRSMVSKRLVWTAESGTMFQTMTPAFLYKYPPSLRKSIRSARTAVLTSSWRSLVGTCKWMVRLMQCYGRSRRKRLV